MCECYKFQVHSFWSRDSGGSNGGQVLKIYQGVSTENKSRLHSCVSERVGGEMCVCNAVVSVCEFYTDAHECEYHHFYEGTVHKKDDSDTIYSSILMFFK